MNPRSVWLLSGGVFVLGLVVALWCWWVPVRETSSVLKKRGEVLTALRGFDRVPDSGVSDRIVSLYDERGSVVSLENVALSVLPAKEMTVDVVGSTSLPGDLVLRDASCSFENLSPRELHDFILKAETLPVPWRFQALVVESVDVNLLKGSVDFSSVQPLGNEP